MVAAEAPARAAEFGLAVLMEKEEVEEEEEVGLVGPGFF